MILCGTGIQQHPQPAVLGKEHGGFEAFTAHWDLSGRRPRAGRTASRVAAPVSRVRRRTLASSTTASSRFRSSPGQVHGLVSLGAQLIDYFLGRNAGPERLLRFRRGQRWPPGARKQALCTVRRREAGSSTGEAPAPGVPEAPSPAAGRGSQPQGRALCCADAEPPGADRAASSSITRAKHRAAFTKGRHQRQVHGSGPGPPAASRKAHGAPVPVRDARPWSYQAVGSCSSPLEGMCTGPRAGSRRTPAGSWAAMGAGAWAGAYNLALHADIRTRRPLGHGGHKRQRLQLRNTPAEPRPGTRRAAPQSTMSPQRHQHQPPRPPARLSPGLRQPDGPGP